MPARQHLLCLTLDTDPDGLSGQTTDRATMRFDGLTYVQTHWDAKQAQRGIPAPMTWFVRADTQIAEHYGTETHLLADGIAFWQARQAQGDELGWHPHLYSKHGDQYGVMSESQALLALTQTWHTLMLEGYRMTSFRMGEGWHTARTYALIESFGFSADSTAIPQRVDSVRDWANTPNQPYFPSQADIRQPNTPQRPRPLVQVPLNTWHYAAPYDTAPRLRYMNPAIHAPLWQAALETLPMPTPSLCVWVFIVHPDEVAPSRTQNALYAHDLATYWANVRAFVAHWEALGESVLLTTIQNATTLWRKAQETSQ